MNVSLRMYGLFAILALFGVGCTKTVATPTPSAPLAPIPISFQSRTIAETSSTYMIDVKYPELQGGVAETALAFNAIAERHAQELVDGFKRDVIADQGEPALFERPWALEQDFESHVVSPRLISIESRGGLDSGGAHPNGIFDTWMFDVEQKREVSPADLFKTDAPYLQKLSELSLAELHRDNDVQQFTDESWLSNGTAPTVENFQFTYLTKDGVVVIFPPYQVAAYAMGPMTLTFPFDAFGDMWEEGMKP